VLVWGGDGGGGRDLVDGAVYDPAADTWTDIAAAPASAARACAKAIAVSDTDVVIAAGVASSGPSPRADDLLVYHGKTDTWSVLPGSTNVYDIAAKGTDVALVGLEPGSGAVIVSLTDLRTGKTHRLADPSIGDRPQAVGLLWSGADLMLLSSTAGSSTIESYSMASDRWRRLEMVASERLSAPAGVAVSVTGPVPAGLADVMSGTPAVVGWGRRQVSVVTPAGVRSVATGGYCGVGAAGVWTGSSLIAWGGQDCSAGSGQVATGVAVTVTGLG
jgi:hypothetical protein